MAFASTASSGSLPLPIWIPRQRSRVWTIARPLGGHSHPSYAIWALQDLCEWRQARHVSDSQLWVLCFSPSQYRDDAAAQPPTASQESGLSTCTVSTSPDSYDALGVGLGCTGEFRGVDIRALATRRRRRARRDSTAQEDSEGPSRSISAPLDAYDAPQLPTWAPTGISGCLPPRFLDGAVTQPHQSTYARTIGLDAPHTRSLGAPGRLLAARGERPGGVCSHGMPPASARIRARVCDDAARFWRVRVRGYGPTELASRRAIPASLGCWGGVRVEGVPGACSRSSACSFGRAGSTLAPCTVRVR